MEYRFMWADGKLAVSSDPMIGHYALLQQLGFDRHTNYTTNEVGGFYTPGINKLSIYYQSGLDVPTNEQLIAEIDKKILPDHTGSYFFETQKTAEEDIGDKPEVEENPNGHPTENSAAFMIAQNYPFIVDSGGKMHVGPWKGYHSDIFKEKPDLTYDLPTWKGRFNPYKNQYYLYHYDSNPNSPELAQRLHETFNSPNTPYNNHLASRKIAAPYETLVGDTLVPFDGGWVLSWVYDRSSGIVYKCHNHIDVISNLANAMDKIQNGDLICGWFGHGYYNGDYTIGARIATDTVDQSLANSKSPLAQQAMKAAIIAYRKGSTVTLKTVTASSWIKFVYNLKTHQIAMGSDHWYLLSKVGLSAYDEDSFNKCVAGYYDPEDNQIEAHGDSKSLPALRPRVLSAIHSYLEENGYPGYNCSIMEGKTASPYQDDRCWMKLKDGQVWKGMTHWELIQSLEEHGLTMADVASFGGGDCAQNWNRSLQYYSSRDLQKYVWANGHLELTAPQYINDEPYHINIIESMGLPYNYYDDKHSVSMGYYHPEEDRVQPYHEQNDPPDEDTLKKLIQEKNKKGGFFTMPEEAEEVYHPPHHDWQDHEWYNDEWDED